jgi:hypothetical protein
MTAPEEGFRIMNAVPFVGRSGDKGDCGHPLQYALCCDVYVGHTENMSDTEVWREVARRGGPGGGYVSRFNRCPTCEQWSPCEVRRAEVADDRCCDMHGRNCEQGGEECCVWCTEAHHFDPGHGGVPCSNPDLSAEPFRVWTPAQPGDTPGQCEPDDARPAPIDLSTGMVERCQPDGCCRPCTEDIGTDRPCCVCLHTRSGHLATPDHPLRRKVEDHCHRCGGPNLVWMAPSPLWNEVMRGGNINGAEPWHGIVCPTCFAMVAEEKGYASLWRLSAQRVHVALVTVTPSGRVWNDKTWMWDADVCPRCGSSRWVGHRYGPECDGWALNRQCVPCGAVRKWPKDVEDAR